MREAVEAGRTPPPTVDGGAIPLETSAGEVASRPDHRCRAPAAPSRAAGAAAAAPQGPRRLAGRAHLAGLLLCRSASAAPARATASRPRGCVHPSHPLLARPIQHPARCAVPATACPAHACEAPAIACIASHGRRAASTTTSLGGRTDAAAIAARHERRAATALAVLAAAQVAVSAAAPLLEIHFPFKRSDGEVM